MEHNSVDRDLLRWIQYDWLKSETDSGKSTVAYVTDAEIVCAGQHYLIVRTGPYKGKRAVDIWSREALLLKTPTGKSENAMMVLAVAAIDPIHRRWGFHLRRTICESGNSHAGMKQFKGRRWCNKLINEIFDFHKREEERFDERETTEIARQARGHEFSQNLVAYAEDTGAVVHGTKEWEGIKRPSNKSYSISLNGNEEPSTYGNEQFRFTPKSDMRVVVQSTRVTLDGPECELLMDAFLAIKRKREAEKNGTEG